jgi:sugar phosphate isomerase/epimerase
MFRTCLPVTLNNAYPKAMVIFRGLEEGLKKTAELGYDGVELALWRKDLVDTSSLRELLTHYNLAVPVISAGQIYTLENAWFTHRDKAVRDHALQLMKGLVDLASELGSDINISRVRGARGDDDTEQEAYNRLNECLYELARYAEPLGTKLLLEQMNLFETNMLHSVEEVGDYIRKQKIPNLLIHADTFHMNIHDIDMCGVLEKYKDLLGYIHLSDSNRRYPGAGHIDFNAIIAKLNEIGYTGWTGVEMLLYPDAVTAARRAIEYLRAL